MWLFIFVDKKLLLHKVLVSPCDWACFDDNQDILQADSVDNNNNANQTKPNNGIMA